VQVFKTKKFGLSNVKTVQLLYSDLKRKKRLPKYNKLALP